MSKEDKILEACQILIHEAINNLNFDRRIQVKVIAVNGDGTYNATYHGQMITNIKGRVGSTFSVNDICWVVIPNNNFSLMFIDNLT